MVPACLLQVRKSCSSTMLQPFTIHSVGTGYPKKMFFQVRLFNGSALADMRMGRFDEAEQALQEALEKDPKSADTLANLITVSLHLGKPVSRHSK